MVGYDLKRRVIAEALGTAFLVATVVGSGIMAETLTKDVALSLLGNTIATGAILMFSSRFSVQFRARTSTPLFHSSSPSKVTSQD